MGDTIIQLLMERRIWSGIIKTNGGGWVCVSVFLRVRVHMFARGEERARGHERQTSEKRQRGVKPTDKSKDLSPPPAVGSQ